MALAGLGPAPLPRAAGAPPRAPGTRLAAPLRPAPRGLPVSRAPAQARVGARCCPSSRAGGGLAGLPSLAEEGVLGVSRREAGVGCPPLWNSRCLPPRGDPAVRLEGPGPDRAAPGPWSPDGSGKPGLCGVSGSRWALERAVHRCPTSVHGHGWLRPLFPAEGALQAPHSHRWAWEVARCVCRAVDGDVSSGVTDRPLCGRASSAPLWDPIPHPSGAGMAVGGLSGPEVAPQPFPLAVFSKW